MKNYMYEFLKGRANHVVEPVELKKEFKLTNLLAVYYNNFAPKFKFVGTRERHNFFELYYVADGKTIAKIANEKYPMEAGEYVLVPPMLYHTMEPNKSYSTGIAVEFDAEDYPENLFFGKLSDFGKQVLTNILRIYAKNYNQSEFRPKVLPASEEEKDYAFGQALSVNIEMLMLIVLQDMKRKERKTTAAPQKTVDPLAADIMNYLEKRYQDNPSLVEIATEFNYSVSHICRVFKRSYNDSIVNYIIKLKINEALKLIEQNEKSFNDICDILGFDDMAYFSRLFKKYTGMTPSAYRKNATWTHLINSKYLPQNLKL